MCVTRFNDIFHLETPLKMFPQKKRVFVGNKLRKQYEKFIAPLCCTELTLGEHINFSNQDRKLV